MKIEHYMAIALALIIIFTFPIFPIPQQVNADDVIIIKTSGTPSCAGANSFVLAQNLTDLCDVTIISPSTNQILKYNGTQWINSAVSFENTVCNNLGAGVILCRDGNVNMKTLTSGTGISITNSSTTVTVTNTSPESTACNNLGTVGSILCIGGNLNIKKILDESGNDCVEVLSNATRLLVRDDCIKDAINALGNGVSIIHSVVAPDLTLRKILGINGISVTSNGTVLVDGSALQNQETTTCTNAGGTTLIKTSSGGSCVFKGLTNGAGITITSNTNDNNIKTNFANGTGITITGSTTQTFTNTGVISNSCSAGITCSGTNPSTFTVKWEQLCQTTLGSANATLVCNISARTNLMIDMDLISNGGTGVEPALRFNGDSGNNYSWRSSANGAADTTAVTTSRCNLGSNGGLSPTTDTIKAFMYIDNFSASRKIGFGQKAVGSDTSAGTAPSKAEVACKWDNTSTQITKITVIAFSGTGNYNTGSILTVWGYN